MSNECRCEKPVVDASRLPANFTGRIRCLGCEAYRDYPLPEDMEVEQASPAKLAETLARWQAEAAEARLPCKCNAPRPGPRLDRWYSKCTSCGRLLMAPLPEAELSEVPRRRWTMEERIEDVEKRLAHSEATVEVLRVKLSAKGGRA